jgi:hypothetical protein
MKHLLGAAVSAGVLLASAAAWAGPTQQSFTPTGYKYPLMKIALSHEDLTGAVSLYECEGATPSDCLVDLADEDALADLSAQAQDVELDEGEYSRLTLTMCPAGTSGSTTTTVSVLGSVLVDETEFVTNGAALGGMSEEGSPEFTDVTLGCGQISLSLLEPLVVTAGSELSLSLLVDLTDMVWTDQSASPGMGGCKADGGALQDLCTTMPNVVPYVGTGTPHLERYLISHLSGAGEPALADANAAVNLAIDGDDDVFWVLAQPYYSPTSASWVDATKGGADYNTQVRTFSTNEDGSVAFQTGGSVEDDRVGFTHFERATHNGICKNEDPASPEWNYRAFQQ